jgi:hypothetical protein
MTRTKRMKPGVMSMFHAMRPRSPWNTLYSSAASSPSAGS